MLLDDHHIQNAMMIGDRKSDIEAAKKNSLTAVGCQFGFAEEQELNEADVLIADFRELQTYVTHWLLTSNG